VRRSPTALLVAGPVGAVVVAAIAGVYPFGGFRQSTVLLLPLALGIAAGLPVLVLRRTLPLSTTTLLLSCLAVALAPEVAPSGFPKSAQRRTDLDEALSRVDSARVAGSPVLVDLQSSLVLAWYRGLPGKDYWVPGHPGLKPVEMSGLTVRIASDWVYGPDTLRRDLRAIRSESGHLPGAELLFVVWPQPGLTSALGNSATPGGIAGRVEWFGAGILLARFPALAGAGDAREPGRSKRPGALAATKRTSDRVPVRGSRLLAGR
jgi:hypothetical protein